MAGRAAVPSSIEEIGLEQRVSPLLLLPINATYQHLHCYSAHCLGWQCAVGLSES